MGHFDTYPMGCRESHTYAAACTLYGCDPLGMSGFRMPDKVSTATHVAITRRCPMTQQKPNDRTDEVKIHGVDEAGNLSIELPAPREDEQPMIEAYAPLDIKAMYRAYSAAATQFLALLPEDQTATNFEQLYRAALDTEGLTELPLPEGYDWPTTEGLEKVNGIIAGWRDFEETAGQEPTAF